MGSFIITNTPAEDAIAVETSQLLPLSTADYTIGIDGFNKLFTLSAEYIWGVDKSNSILVLPAYPDEVVNYGARSSVNPTQTFQRCITYQTVRREPGAIGGEATGPFEGRKEWKPRLRDTQYNEETEKYVEIYGQRFDNLVQFDCWSKSNEESQEILNWLETFLIGYAWFFKKCGVQEMFYFRSGRFTWGTSEEEAVSMWRNPLKVRSLVWFIRTEDLYAVEKGKIERIDVNITLNIPI